MADSAATTPHPVPGTTNPPSSASNDTIAGTTGHQSVVPSSSPSSSSGAVVRNWASILSQPSKPPPPKPSSKPAVYTIPSSTSSSSSSSSSGGRDEAAVSAASTTAAAGKRGGLAGEKEDEKEKEGEETTVGNSDDSSSSSGSSNKRTTKEKKNRPAWRERPSLAEQHEQQRKPKRTVLVLDTGALIKGVRIERLGSEYWTIQEVLDEVRDSKARDFLNTFPFDIQVTEPAGQDLKAVVDFAKKTGDYASLSLTDLKVIALTRMFEREHNGTDHLRVTPPLPTLVPRKDKKQQQQQQAKPGAPLTGGRVDIAGQPRGGSEATRGGRGRGGRGRGGAHAHGLGHTATATTTTPTEQTADHSEEPTAEEENGAGVDNSVTVGDKTGDEVNTSVDQKPEAKETQLETQGISEQKEVPSTPTEVEPNTASSDSVAKNQEAVPSASSSSSESGSSAQQNSEGEKSTQKRKHNRGKQNADAPNGGSSRPGSHPSSRRNSTAPTPWPQPKDSGDDDGGWITPDNIDQMKRSDARVASIDDLVRRAQVGVACITTDYAMQNVLIQMGLHLLSTEGMVIKKLRTYLLQCHACFKTTKEMDKVFCPNCGHQTLRKVPYVVDERTGQPILLANRVSRPVSVRGTKFSLPLPKGGRHEQKIILREDELLEQTRRRKKKDGDDIFDDDKAFLMPRQQNQAKFVVGKTRRNPNESRHRTGKRKKNSGGLN